MSNKKITIVNEQVLSTGNSDALRDYLYKWTVSNGNLEYSRNQDNNDINIVVEVPVGEKRPSPSADALGRITLKDNLFTIPSYEPATQTDYPVAPGAYRSFGTKTQKIIIDDNRGFTEFYSPETAKAEFKNLVGDLLGSSASDNPDFVTIMATQPIIEEMINARFDNPSGQQGVAFGYNYFDADYEEELDKVSDHYYIPNIYETTNIDSGQDTENLFKTPLVEKLRANLRDPAGSLRTQNQIVPIENNTEFYAAGGYASFFPMVAEITVSTGGEGNGTDIANTFFDTELGVNFTRDVENIAPPSSGLVSLRNENITISSNYTNPEGENIIEAEDIDNIKAINLAEWVDQDGAGWIGLNAIPNNFYFIGPLANSSEQSVAGDSVLLMANTNLFYDRMKDLAQSYERGYHDILKGTPAYSETLMYKIEKFIGPIDSIVTSEPIQSFHFMNYKDLTDFHLDQLEQDQQQSLKFVDTQVKYGQDYSYAVTVYQAIVGSQYKYDTQSLVYNLESNPYSAEINVETETVIRVIEMPLYAAAGRVLDIPPLPPQVDFKPIQGSADKARISLDMSAGAYDLEPIALNVTEQNAFDQMATNQYRSDGLLTFGSDTAPAEFEIYRLATPPLKYQDFDGSRLTSVPTLSSDRKTKRQASSATYIAGQPINQKFYYMFRSLDHHGGLSNPSPVFEVEMYGDSGVTFPIVKEYQFGQISPKTDSKGARKIIQVLPRFTQAYLNEEASGLVDPMTGERKAALNNNNIHLGVEDEPLFGSTTSPRKFKLRITSKTTGKKVDLNVSFKTKRVRGQTE